MCCLVTGGNGSSLGVSDWTGAACASELEAELLMVDEAVAIVSQEDTVVVAGTIVEVVP